MIPGAPNLNCLWSQLLIEELVRCGVRKFCVAPGSRSGLLIAAAARHPLARIFVHVDERALGFYATGYASASGQPVAVIVTSGTAVANLLPSVIEASKKKVPLIVISADRPPELQKTGAMQTIDQPGLFGPNVRASFDLPCPDRNIPPSFVLTTAAAAVARARGELSGPVHINCLFREPISCAPDRLPVRKYLSSLDHWRRSGEPFTVYEPVLRTLSEDGIADVLRRLGRVRNGIIAVGKVGSARERADILALAERLGWPVWPDITSGLRSGSGHPLVASYFDRMLGASEFVRRLKVDGILHLGGRMTSRRFYQFAAQCRGEYISVLGHPLRSDPLHRVTARVVSEVGVFCRAATAGIKPRPVASSAALLLKASSLTGDIIRREFDAPAGGGVLTPSAIARIISRIIPRTHTLFLSNSLPVREADMFADHSGADVPVAGNRGASGIDGIIASAAGYAEGSGRPLTLFIGDLACLYDLNSLACLKDLAVPLTMVVSNNDGGGIFSHLPLAGESDIFESFIAAPHGLTFRKGAEMFAVDYINPKTRQDLARVYARSVCRTSGACLIECQSSRSLDMAFHVTLDRMVVERLKRLG